MQTVNVKENITIKGKISIYTYKGGTHEKAAPFIRKWKATKDRFPLMGRYYKACFEKIFKDNQIGEPNVTDNLIMTASNLGRDLIIQRLCGTNTYSLNLSYGEIGTGVTTPTSTDAALTTPVARAALTAGVAQDISFNQAQIQYFFTDAVLTNTTYYEGGTFVDGTATPGSGQMFNHALFITPYTKSAGTDVTMQVNITIT